MKVLRLPPKTIYEHKSYKTVIEILFPIADTCPQHLPEHVMILRIKEYSRVMPKVSKR